MVLTTVICVRCRKETPHRRVVSPSTGAARYICTKCEIRK